MEGVHHIYINTLYSILTQIILFYLFVQFPLPFISFFLGLMQRLLLAWEVVHLLYPNLFLPPHNSIIYNFFRGTTSSIIVLALRAHRCIALLHAGFKISEFSVLSDLIWYYFSQNFRYFNIFCEFGNFLKNLTKFCLKKKPNNSGVEFPKFQKWRKRNIKPWLRDGRRCLGWVIYLAGWWKTALP